MFTDFNWGKCFGGEILDIGLEITDYIIIAVAVIIVSLVTKLSSKRDIREWLLGKTTLSWLLSGAAVIVILLFGVYGQYVPFIYGQF